MVGSEVSEGKTASVDREFCFECQKSNDRLSSKGVEGSNSDFKGSLTGRDNGVLDQVTGPGTVRSGHSKYILKAELWVVNKGLIPKTVAQANEKIKCYLIKEGD